MMMMTTRGVVAVRKLTMVIVVVVSLLLLVATTTVVCHSPSSSTTMSSSYTNSNQQPHIRSGTTLMNEVEASPEEEISQIIRRLGIGYGYGPDDSYEDVLFDDERDLNRLVHSSYSSAAVLTRAMFRSTVSVGDCQVSFAMNRSASWGASSGS